MTIPASLIAAYRALPWDDRGLCYEFPAGENRTWSNTHTDLGNPYGTPVDQFGIDTNLGAFGKVMLHDRPIPDAWMIEAIPPSGTAVWQLKGPHLHIIRTSEISYYTRGGFILAQLKAAGPYPGTPVKDDSGSICFVRHRGRWQVLGNCNTFGSCSLPFWDTNLISQKGFTIPPRNNMALDAANWSKAWTETDETMFLLMKSLILSQNPTNRRVVAEHEMKDDGTDNIALDIAELAVPITSVEIRGAGTDKWAWPDNGANWIIRASKLGTGTLRLWFKASKPTASYTVWVNGNQTTSVLVKDFAETPSQPAPANSPATNDDRQYLMEKIAALESINARQAALILRLRETFSELLKP